MTWGGDGKRKPKVNCSFSQNCLKFKARRMLIFFFLEAGPEIIKVLRQQSELMAVRLEPTFPESKTFFSVFFLSSY